MTDLSNYMQLIIDKILSFKSLKISLVKDPDFFIILCFNAKTYKAVSEQIKGQDWEAIKNNKDQCETTFTEDLLLIKFYNENNQYCIATLYDSNELWQDPEVIEIFVFF